MKNRTSYWLDDIIKFEYFNFDNILIDEKLYENILINNILYILFGARPLRVRFDKRDGFIRVYDESRYLESFDLDKYDTIFNRIGYFISLKIRITNVFPNTTQKPKLILMILYL